MQLGDTQLERVEPGVVLSVMVAVVIGLTLITALMGLCVDTMSDIGFHEAVEHKLGELT